MKDIKWLRTPGFLTFVYKGKPITIKNSSKQCQEAEKFIKSGKEQDLINLLYTPEKIKKFTKDEFTVDSKKKTITYNKTNEPLKPVLAEKLIELATDGYCYKAFKKFIENVNKNPDPQSVEQLYAFLEANHFPITSDGCFLAYKSVRRKSTTLLVDHHTGNFNNSVGKTVTMPRSQCDNRRDVTCSRGLHVAAFNYAHGFERNSTLIEVKVNPKDVVAVPNDYNDQKMRVCEYYVVKEGFAEIKRNYLSQRYIAGKVKIKQAEDLGFSESMTAKEIIDYVKMKTGQLITISLKSKKSIIRKAKQLLSKLEE